MRPASVLTSLLTLSVAVLPLPGCQQCDSPPPAGATHGAALAAARRAQARRSGEQPPGDPQEDRARPRALPAAPEIPPAPENMPEDHPPTLKRRTTPVHYVPPADLSITTVLGNRGALDGTRLSVRGKVVKISHGVMGRNWLHLMDRPGGGTLVVSTEDLAGVGDLIRAHGRFGVEVDVGAGFKVAAILQKARVTIEQPANAGAAPPPAANSPQGATPPPTGADGDPAEPAADEEGLDDR